MHDDVGVQPRAAGTSAPTDPLDTPPRPVVPLPPSTMYLLKAAESGVRQHLTRALSGTGVTVAECVSLSILHQVPTMSSAELARRTFVTPQTMQSVVDSLVDKGLLDRRRNEADRREVRLSVTEDGARLIGALTPALQQIDDTIAADLSTGEHALLRELLARIRASLDVTTPLVPDESTDHAHLDPRYGDHPQIS